MRRIDHDGHVTRQGRPPFKVLAVPDIAYLPPPSSVVTPPPPPRAPEPYKVVPSSTSFGRARRRSSFVILAESRPATPESDNASPTLPTGRVSPFRGRGFKGPPPRSMSRPQSPEVAADERRRGRVERRVSVSQQNSPRRSMIPQPTYRQRSTSLTKANDRSSSPKIGRRIDFKAQPNISNSRGRLNAIDSKLMRPNDSKLTRPNDSKTRLNKFDSRSRTNLVEPRTRFISSSTSNLNETRRNSMTTPRNAQRTKVTMRLSPIQGTPTKPEKTTSQSVKEDRANGSTKLSPTKSTSKTSPRNNVASRTDNQGRSNSKERVVSPSKIPLKMNRTGSFTTLNVGKVISTPGQNTERSKKVDKPGSKIIKEGRNDKQIQQSSVHDSVRPFQSNSNIETDGNSPEKMDEVDLMNLLKQSSSHAIGTSSERLVNTTTTTAMQPLHIDANTLSMERNDGLSANQQKERLEMSKISVSPASKDESSLSVRTQNAASTNEKSTPLFESQPGKVNQASNSGSDKRDFTMGAGSTEEHSKSGSKGQPMRNITRTNGDGSAHQRSSNQSSANQRIGKNQNSRGTKANNNTTTEGPETISMTSGEIKSRSVGSKATAGEIPASDRMPTVMENSARIAAGETAEGVEMKTAPAAAATAATATTMSSATMNNSSMGNSMANSTATNNNTTNNATRSSNNVNSAIGPMNASVNSGAVRTRNENRGSDASLKSSTGVSTDSIESVRSTDTGVSVNTIRVVSSPREKTGVHVVKRPQEIETLSGNIVHIEQNGEPVAPASDNDKQRDSERLLARWRRSLNWYCRCCRGMRCLACRRDPKGLLWTRNQGRTMVITDTPPAVAAVVGDAPAPATNTLSCWSKLKTRCRCTRLGTVKCCTRKSRIAPAEPTVCFPPERKFGAMCRRMFSYCRCKRADTQQRTRNVRAKHSLTSVAPPPLSEEPKAKIPDILVEHNSVMRGAIPCLPVPLAWFCLVWNVLLPGSGTVWSGLFNLCTGQPRFSAVAGLKSRLGAFIVNLVVGVGQLFTVLFCLVGWGWSIWWGVTMVRLARKYKRFKASEAASNDPEARGGETTVLPPGVPSQALRGMERAR